MASGRPVEVARVSVAVRHPSPPAAPRRAVNGSEGGGLHQLRRGCRADARAGRGGRLAVLSRVIAFGASPRARFLYLAQAAARTRTATRPRLFVPGRQSRWLPPNVLHDDASLVFV